MKEFATSAKRYDGAEAGCEWEDVKTLQEYDKEEFKDAAYRFCWSAEESDENPKLRPCKCSGSVGFIHYQYLKAWMNTKVSEKAQGATVTQTWKTFECELCKESFPYIFQYKGKRWEMCTNHRPEKSDTPYIVLESIRNDKNNSRYVHTIVVENKTEFKLGRGHESDLRVNDISVSRCHVVIRYTD